VEINSSPAPDSPPVIDGQMKLILTFAVFVGHWSAFEVLLVGIA
jgi:hypothetical protein